MSTSADSLPDSSKIETIFNRKQRNQSKGPDFCDESQSEYNWRLHYIESIPEWLRTNSYIPFGHRPPLNSVKACFWSVFRFHNETGNIWSHFIGCILFLILAIYELNYSQKSSLRASEKLIFGIFFFSVVICLALSSLYHIIACHSRALESFFLRLDFTGIVVTTIGHEIPYIYYGFYCSPKIRAFYLTITIVLGITMIYILMVDKYMQIQYQSMRAAIFLSFGSFGLLPMVHSMVVNMQRLIDEPDLRQPVYCLVIVVIFYYAGTILYYQQIPEKYFPGYCDYWFHSHQLFHIFVLMAMVVHYHGFKLLAEKFRNIPENFCQNIRLKSNTNTFDIRKDN